MGCDSNKGKQISIFGTKSETAIFRVLISRRSPRLKFSVLEFWDWVRDWTFLSIYLKNESGPQIKFWKIFSQNRYFSALISSFSGLRWSGRPGLASFKTKIETGVLLVLMFETKYFWVSISRPSPRLELSESQLLDRVQDHNINWHLVLLYSGFWPHHY